MQLKRIIHTNAPRHFLTFVVEFEAVSRDSKVTGQPQGEDAACAGDRGRDLETCQPMDTQRRRRYQAPPIRRLFELQA